MNYFDDFKSSVVNGIPGFSMNRPLSPNVTTGDVGLEIEVEGVGLPPCPTVSCKTTGGFWVPHADGSLRGEALEYVFDRPVSIESVDDLIGTLYKAFIDHGTKLKLSNRCSTHVHLNVSDWKVNNLSSFLALWSAIEPALIDWCGVERRSNHFCLGLEDTSATVDTWLEFLRTGTCNFRDGLKYTALNPRHLLDFGSWEIRIGKAWEDPQTVVNWVKFLWAFRELVREDFTNPSDIPDYVSFRRAEGIIRDVAAKAGIPDFGEAIIDDGDDINRRGFETFRNSQAICYSFPWLDWLPEINKEYVPNPFAKAAAFTPMRLEGNRLRPARFTRPREEENFIEEDLRPVARPAFNEMNGIFERLRREEARMAAGLERALLVAGDRNGN